MKVLPGRSMALVMLQFQPPNVLESFGGLDKNWSKNFRSTESPGGAEELEIRVRMISWWISSSGT